MSIATELTRLDENATSLETAKTAIVSAITTKGGTVASGDGFEDFATDIASIPSGGGVDRLEAFLNKTTTWIKYTSVTSLAGHMINANNSIRFVSFPNLTSIGTYNGYSVLGLTYANSGKIQSFGNTIWQGVNMKTLIIRTKSVCIMDSTSSNTGFGKGRTHLYCPDFDSNGYNLPAQYRTATNWVNYATQIHGYSEAPAYNASTTYEIGDVCKYNGRFYGYCKEDLTSSTGNAPSGTTADNTYWEYIDDIEENA